MHQHQAHRQAQRQPGDCAKHRPGQAFERHHAQNLPPGQAQVGQQPKLALARQHLRAEACRHAEQANADGHRLQPVGDGEAAVEDAQRNGADLAGRGKCQPIGRALVGGQLAHRVLHRLFAHPVGQIQRQVVHPLVA